MTERFTVDSDGKYWDKINHKYVTIDYLFRLVEKQDKHIFLLKSAIQTITAEAYDKPLSSKRIMEIKDYWYEKMKNEVMWND